MSRRSDIENREGVTALRIRVTVAVLLATMLGFGVLGASRLSATFDETTHLPSGYSYVATGDFRLNPQHPPLVKLLAGLFLLPAQPRIDLTDPAWTTDPPNEWAFGYRFLYGQDADRLLFLGRLPVILLGVLMAFYLFLWARELFGPAAGLLALALCAFSPTVLAHSRFVTFDVALATFSTMALYHLRRHLVGGGRVDLLLAGAALGAAMASKFSGLLIAVSCLLLVAIWALADRRGAAPGTARLRRALLAVGVLVGVALFVVQATYFFSTDLLVYWKGLARVNQDHDPTYPYYLFGSFRPGGWWYYFVAAFAIKTPLPTLLLLIVSPWLVRRHRAPAWWDELFLLVPVAVVVIATSARADDLGVRYLLPIYPLLFVFVSRAALELRRHVALRIAAVLLASWYVGSAFFFFPDQLAYFNELVGGPSRGHRYLDDSNIDWSQDMKRLAAWLDERGIDRVRLRYGPNVAPGYYGIDARPIDNRDWALRPSPGVYVFGTHLLIRGKLQEARDPRLKTDWIERYEPIGRVGYSIWIFEF